MHELTNKVRDGGMMKWPEDYINKVICGDCLEVMKGIPDKSVDLVLTDPPYGIKRDKQAMGKGGGIAKNIDYGDYDWDRKIPSKEYFVELMRISKNQIIFGGNYFVEYLKNSMCWLVWDKDNGNTDFADCELCWTSFNKAVRKYIWKWSGMLQQNMKCKDYRTHPTQKPKELISLILQDYSKEDDLIIDPFLGSGTTAVACKELGRKYIGIEINPKYCEIAERRLAQEYLF